MKSVEFKDKIIESILIIDNEALRLRDLLDEIRDDKRKCRTIHTRRRYLYSSEPLTT